MGPPNGIQNPVRLIVLKYTYLGHMTFPHSCKVSFLHDLQTLFLYLWPDITKGKTNLTLQVRISVC